MVVSISSRRTGVSADPTDPMSTFRLTLDTVDHSLLPIRQTVQERPAESYALGAEAHRLDDVRPSSDASIDIHLALLEHVRAELVDLQQGI